MTIVDRARARVEIDDDRGIIINRVKQRRPIVIIIIRYIYNNADNCASGH